MKISEICIRRPVFATVLSVLIMLVGLVSYTNLSVREYPNIDAPEVSVETRYPGASAEIIETQVSQVLEESIAGIEGIDYIKSTSRQGQSQVTVRFNLDREPSSAAADVRDRVSRVRGNLPDEVEEPIIQKVEADAQPTLYLAFFSNRHSAMELTDYADRYVKDQLQTLSGVAQVRFFGEREYSMRIWLDPDRMAAYRVTPQDVEAAIRRQNVEIPAGRIESRTREFSVLSETGLSRPEQFDNLVIRKTDEGYLVRLGDVGRAEIAPRDERRIARYKGEPTIALGVVKQATANPLEISELVRARLPAIIESLPEGMNAEVAYDRSLFIEESIENVYTTIGEAMVLVVLIIFLFLRSFRAVLIPMVTIPVSLIGAFTVMDLFGFSINTLTLLSMVLAIGLVVDDAIVMLENIYRHVEEGMKPLQAALLGSKEIGFAVLAMTLTLAAVYFPIGFMGGTTGRLFTEFALTLAGAVLVSGFVALTASPMMCALLLRNQESHGWFYRVVERGLDFLTDGYRRLLSFLMGARIAVLGVGLVVAGSSYFFFSQLDSELAPFEDTGTVIAFTRGPEGATLEYMDRYAREIEAELAAVPEVERYFMISGLSVLNDGVAFAGLEPWSERDRTAPQINGLLNKEFSDVPGVFSFAVPRPPLGQSVRNKPVELVVQTTRPYEELKQVSEAMMAKLRERPELFNLESDLVLNKPQIKIDIDRDKAADLGISAEVLGRTLETLLGGRQVTRYKYEGRQYDVMVQIAGRYRTTPDNVPTIYLRSEFGELVQLANLVTIQETLAPRELNHFNQLRSATISSNLAEGVTQAEGLAIVEQVAAEVLPATTQTEYGGQSREFKSASSGIYFTFILALAFIYLVLAAQFESFRNPFIIMLTVPLSMTGGLAALWLDGSTLNIYSQVGLVTLIGLITKHGILIVEFANQLRDTGMSRREAVVEAAVMRLRPILMTTGAMVFGALPLAIAIGAGAESRQDIGLVIVGGMLVGTFFTLFVIPTVYTFIAGRTAAAASGQAQDYDALPEPRPAE